MRALGLLFAAAACDNTLDCTNAGCIDGFFITVSELLPPDAGLASQKALPEGDYEIELSLDSKVVFCRWTLPRPLDAQLECDDRSVRASPIVPMLPERPVVGFVLEVNQTPRIASAIVRHQGSVVAQDTFTLSYQRSAPNGEACGPVCRYAAPTQLPLSF